MGYDSALNKAWGELPPGPEKTTFLGEEYYFDRDARSCVSSSGGRIKPYLSILLLHYATAVNRGIPEPRGEWISFKELPGGEVYYAAFRKRALEPLLAEYGGDPRASAAGLCGYLPAIAKELPEGDACLVVEAFPGVPVKIIFWQADEEFPADAVMLFDRGAGMVFCTEDIAVLGGMLAADLCRALRFS